MGFGDELVRIMGVKIIADGSLGARTAWLSKPYSDDPGNNGYPNIGLDGLKRLVAKAHGAGLQVAIHSIGDRALDMVLEAYRSLVGVSAMRHRVEHASLTRDDQLVEIKRLGLAVSIQPRFAVSDWWAGERLGTNRVKLLYRFKTMAEIGIPLGISTDSPVEPLNPWETVYAAISERKPSSAAAQKPILGEALTIVDTLYYYTLGSAYIMHEERSLGTLEEGKLADFVVIDRDPLETPVEEITGIKVLETYVGGEKVYG